ncbi:14608_t:CDS:2 [Funneliformis mosseae]|uniref:14608_t:CDS:1 n=1 Tax=Funneliformis mosseae TaxID=27381 RepID=A0A9N9EBQ9_FUNMO|nr:14608_t:CDS:2 [Funneliformis mosseae]
MSENNLQGLYTNTPIVTGNNEHYNDTSFATTNAHELTSLYASQLNTSDQLQSLANAFNDNGIQPGPSFTYDLSVTNHNNRTGLYTNTPIVTGNNEQYHATSSTTNGHESTSLYVPQLNASDQLQSLANAFNDNGIQPGPSFTYDLSVTNRNNLTGLYTNTPIVTGNNEQYHATPFVTTNGHESTSLYTPQLNASDQIQSLANAFNDNGIQPGPSFTYDLSVMNHNNLTGLYTNTPILNAIDQLQSLTNAFNDNGIQPGPSFTYDLSVTNRNNLTGLYTNTPIVTGNNEQYHATPFVTTNGHESTSLYTPQLNASDQIQSLANAFNDNGIQPGPSFNELYNAAYSITDDLYVTSHNNTITPIVTGNNEHYPVAPFATNGHAQYSSHMPQSSVTLELPKSSNFFPSLNSPNEINVNSPLANLDMQQQFQQDINYLNNYFHSVNQLQLNKEPFATKRYESDLQYPSHKY